MLNRWIPALLQKPARLTAPKPPEEGVDLGDLSEQLYEIAGELDVIMTASQITKFHETEAFGLYLILRRQINRLKAINEEICAAG